MHLFKLGYCRKWDFGVYLDKHFGDLIEMHCFKKNLLQFFGSETLIFVEVTSGKLIHSLLYSRIWQFYEFDITKILVYVQF